MKGSERLKRKIQCIFAGIILFVLFGNMTSIHATIGSQISLAGVSPGFIRDLFARMPHNVYFILNEDPATAASPYSSEFLAEMSRQEVAPGSFARMVHGPGKTEGAYYGALGKEYGFNLYQQDIGGNPLGTIQSLWYSAFPGAERVAYMKKLAEKAYQAGAKYINFEEPEWVQGSGYEPRFRELFQKEYGYAIDWQTDSGCTLRQRYDMERLKEKLMAEAYQQLAADLKKSCPELKIIVPIHDLNHYQRERYTSTLAGVMQNPNIDIIQSQTWDPSLSGWEYPRIAGYYGLNYWIAGGKYLEKPAEKWVLSDPIADFAKADEADRYVTAFRSTNYLAMMLGYTGLTIPWPDRIVKSLEAWQREGYWSEIAAISHIFDNSNDFAHSELATQPAVGVVYSTGANYLGYPCLDPAITQIYGFYSNAGELLERGYPFQTLEGDLLDNPRMWSDLKLVLIDPPNGGLFLKQQAADRLVEWVKNGGVAVWVNHPGQYQEIPYWSQSSESPLRYVLDKLDVTEKIIVKTDKTGRLKSDRQIQTVATGKGRFYLVNHQAAFLETLPAAAKEAGIVPGPANEIKTIRSLGEKKFIQTLNLADDKPPEMEYQAPGPDGAVWFVRVQGAAVVGEAAGSHDVEVLPLRLVPWSRDWNQNKAAVEEKASLSAELRINNQVSASFEAMIDLLPGMNTIRLIYDKKNMRINGNRAEADPPGPFDLLEPSLAAEDLTCTPTLKWQRSGNAAHYLLVVSRELDLSEPEISEVILKGTEYTVKTPLRRGQTYYWKVTAIQGDVVRPASGQGSFTTAVGDLREFDFAVNVNGPDTKYLISAEGTGSFDNARFADGKSALVYKFDLPDTTVRGKITVTVANEYVIWVSKNGANWTEKARYQKHEHNMANLGPVSFDLSEELKDNPSKTIYLKLGDAFPNDGWGSYVQNVKVSMELESDSY